MINIAYTKLYQNPVLSVNACTNALDDVVENPTIVIGMNINACAKMIGITPALFTFKGMYCLAPPYCLLPTILFAYCTGTLRVPCTNRIDAASTNNRNTISAKNITNPPVAVVARLMNSNPNACGRRAMIPIKIMNEIPFPIPLSVMRSPNHNTNILPAARMIVDVIINITP